MPTYLNAAVVKHGQTQELRCDVDELCVSHILWVFVEWNALGHLHGDVGGVIAVRRVAGTLYGGRFFDDVTIQPLGFEHVTGNIGNQ